MQVECSDVQTVVSILSSPVRDVVHLADDHSSINSRQRSMSAGTIFLVKSKNTLTFHLVHEDRMVRKLPTEIHVFPANRSSDKVYQFVR